MGGIKHCSEYDVAPDELKVVRLAIAAKPKEMAIRIRAINFNDEVLSESMMSPEDAYSFARAILTCYDGLMEIQ
jgi:hypothetical protein